MGPTGFNQASAQGTLPDNGMEEINAHPGVYSGAVINVLWSQLEPQQGVFDDSAIESALSNIVAYNAKYPATTVAAKLRINAGIGTPQWVETLTGGPITIAGYNGDITIGAFWSNSYKAAWQALQSHLASVYDNTTRIAEVAVTSCSSISDEPFIEALDYNSLSNMRQYGFSDATATACLSGAKDDYAAWQNTPLDFTFSPYRNSDGCTSASNCSPVQNPGFSNAVMDQYRSSVGARAVIANHALQNPVASQLAPIYVEFLNLGDPVELQTISPEKEATLGESWDSIIQLGIQTYHATEVEIWQTTASGGQADISQSDLDGWSAEL
jgi:hypothetical protein